jgi:hypothetical protein
VHRVIALSRGSLQRARLRIRQDASVGRQSRYNRRKSGVSAALGHRRSVGVDVERRSWARPGRRHNECGAMDRLLKRVRAGQSQVLVVRGEPASANRRCSSTWRRARPVIASRKRPAWRARWSSHMRALISCGGLASACVCTDAWSAGAAAQPVVSLSVLTSWPRARVERLDEPPARFLGHRSWAATTGVAPGGGDFDRSDHVVASTAERITLVT